MGICYDADPRHFNLSLESEPVAKAPSTKSNTSLEKVSPLQLYLKEIAKYPLLDPEEEFELAKKQYDGDDVAAAHRLVTSNLRLVVKIANDFRQAQIQLLDLIQEGNYGLMQAVKKYNPYKGVKLSSYAAWWIRAYILKHIMDNKSQVKIGTTAAQRKLFYNLEKVRQKLLREFDEVDSGMLAEALNVKEKDVIEMQKRLSSPDVSMEAPIGNDDSLSTRGDMIPDDVNSAEEILADKQLMGLFKEHVSEFQKTLKDRDLEIFEARLMSDSPETLQQIGDRYGISRERARQIEARIIQKLREYVNARGEIDVEVVRS